MDVATPPGRRPIRWADFGTRIALLVGAVYTVLFFAGAWLLAPGLVGTALGAVFLLGLLAALGATFYSASFLIRRTRRIQDRGLLVEDTLDRLLHYLEDLPVAVLVLDSSGRPVYANEVSDRILGKPPDRNAIPERFASVYNAFVQGTDLPYPTDRMPMVRALRGEKQAQASDMELHRDGRRVPLQVWANPVVDKDGRVRYAVAAFVEAAEPPPPG